MGNEGANIKDQTGISIVDKDDSDWSGKVRESVREFSRSGIFEQAHLDAWMFKMTSESTSERGVTRRRGSAPSLRYRCFFCSETFTTEVTRICDLL